MTTVTLEEMRRTLANALTSTPSGDAIVSALESEDLDRGIMAVLDKHVGPMLAEAARKAWWAGREYHGTHTGATCDRDAENISKDVIKSIRAALEE